MSETKLLSPKLDVVFQRLFGELGSEKITKGFVEKILGEKIEKIDLSKNPILRRETVHGKLGVLDVLVEFNEKEKINLEMQVAKKDDLPERLLYYWSRRYAKTIKESEDYQALKRTISILITDFEVKGLEELEMHSKWKIIEENGKKHVLTEDLELHIIELPKIKKMQETKENSKLLKWLKFLENPESEEVEIYMKENVNMKEARVRLEGISEDERMQRIAELREKAILDEKEAKYTGYMSGLEEGRKDGKELGLKEGREEGREEGRKEGRKEGIKEGREEGREEIIKKMLKANMSIEQISELTEIKREEIEKIMKKTENQ